MEIVEHPCATAVQLSGTDPDGKPILSVVAKRAYAIENAIEPTPKPESPSLVEEPVADSAIPDLLLEDTDLYPFKPKTDVVIKGHAYNHPGRPQFTAYIRIDDHAYGILVSGKRRCAVSAGNRIVFSDPDIPEKVPLSYTEAYGGKDRTLEKRVGNPTADLLQNFMDPSLFDLSLASPLLYPRNPYGKGYVIEIARETLERTELPRLEDPEDPLTPERFAVGNLANWVNMPIPQCPFWVSYGWFPRILAFGVLPLPVPRNVPVTEIEKGLMAWERIEPEALTPAHALTLTNGAPLGLQLPHLKGGETIHLNNLHPRHPELRFSLPKSAPRIWTDGRKGKLNPTDPVLHTVVIEPDTDTLTLVWRGSAPALRPYLPKELEKMPFRVEWPSRRSRSRPESGGL